MQTKTKAVAYSYPTSINAERFGFGKLGCYCVEEVTGIDGVPKPPVAIAGFATEPEAKAFAATLPHPWDRFTR